MHDFLRVQELESKIEGFEDYLQSLIIDYTDRTRKEREVIDCVYISFLNQFHSSKFGFGENFIYTKKKEITMFKTKSFWAGTITILSGAAMILNGQMETGIQTILTGISTISIRHAILKKGDL